jgi:tetratricopeptide (TPR) repeat protein
VRAARRLLPWALGAALAAGIWPLVGRAFANVAAGEVLENEDLPTADGRREPFLSHRARANVFIFFRPGQDHSLDTLKAMAACEKEFAQKPVRWVAIVSDGAPRAEVLAAAREAGIRMPVLVDEGDHLYGKLGVRLHPVIGIADGGFKLLDYLPFHKINYCDMIRIRIQRALGEVDQAAVDRVDNPPKALMPDEIPGAVARRHIKLGEKLLAAGHFAQAEQNARIAVAQLPDDAPAQALLGRALAAQGKCAEAAPALEKALKLEPKNALAVEGRRSCAGKR